MHTMILSLGVKNIGKVFQGFFKLAQPELESNKIENFSSFFCYAFSKTVTIHK